MNDTEPDSLTVLLSMCDVTGGEGVLHGGCCGVRFVNLHCYGSRLCSHVARMPEPSLPPSEEEE